jgi:Uma2 family endonuclease
MGVDEYLRTSFEGADCDFLDGEVVERNMGELPHSTAQARLIYLLMLIAEKTGIRVQPEIRVQINPRRFRVADIAVWRAGNIGTRVPSVPPFLVIEILSAEDRMVRMQPRIQEYLSIGVEYVWLIDPQERQALLYSQQAPAGRLEDTLRTENPSFEIPLESVLAS